MEMLHHAIFPYASDKVLMDLYMQAQTAAVSMAGDWKAKDLSSEQWGPGNVRSYLLSLREELTLRGQKFFEYMEEQTWFRDLMEKHKKEDLLWEIIPQTNTFFIQTVVVLYLTDPGVGRLRRDPDSIIDAIDWSREAERREAGLRLIKGKWWEVFHRA